MADTSIKREKKWLGKGSFGNAYLITEEKESGIEIYVEKIINLKIGEDEMKKEAELEAKVLKKLRHPNIIKFRDVKYHRKGEHTELVISMAYAEQGSLESKIKERISLSSELKQK